jgi:hypothetical protein
MPQGKPAGERCVQLSTENLCKLIGRPERPAVCISYQASGEFCGLSRSEAMRLLKELELMTDLSDKSTHKVVSSKS